MRSESGNSRSRARARLSRRAPAPRQHVESFRLHDRGGKAAGPAPDDRIADVDRSIASLNPKTVGVSDQRIFCRTSSPADQRGSSLLWKSSSTGVSGSRRDRANGWPLRVRNSRVRSVPPNGSSRRGPRRRPRRDEPAAQDARIGSRSSASTCQGDQLFTGSSITSPASRTGRGTARRPKSGSFAGELTWWGQSRSVRSIQDLHDFQRPLRTTKNGTTGAGFDKGVARADTGVCRGARCARYARRSCREHTFVAVDLKRRQLAHEERLINCIGKRSVEVVSLWYWFFATVAHAGQ